MNNIKTILKALRKFNRMTQAELAKRVGATTRTLQTWEAGVKPSPLYRRALARALGVPVGELPV